MTDAYAGLVEQWKVKLVMSRARKKGFGTDETEDLLQEVVLAIIEFEFDSGKSNGATERTALTALVDRKLKHMQRSASRRMKHERLYRELCGQYDAQNIPAESSECDPADEISLKMDLGDMVARLSKIERIICKALSKGLPRSRIARKLQLSHGRIDRIIGRIRERFTTRDLHEWGME